MAEHRSPRERTGGGFYESLRHRLRAGTKWVKPVVRDQAASKQLVERQADARRLQAGHSGEVGREARVAAYQSVKHPLCRLRMRGRIGNSARREREVAGEKRDARLALAVRLRAPHPATGCEHVVEPGGAV